MPYNEETGRLLRTMFGEHRCAVCANDASQVVSDMKIGALCPISGSSDSRKRHKMRLIFKLETVLSLRMNKHFSYI